MSKTINVVVAKKVSTTIVTPKSPFHDDEPPVYLKNIPTLTGINVYTKLSNLTDVDSSQKTAGGVPVYNPSIDKYQIRRLDFEELRDGVPLDGGDF